MKIGVYLPEGLARKLSRVRSESGMSLSKIVQLALSSYLSTEEFARSESVIAVIGVVYDHTIHDADIRLTDIQHSYLNNVISAAHIHLDERNCLLAIFVKGRGSDVEKCSTRSLLLEGLKPLG
ncbi:MAG: CopG family transcriptional regulator [Thermogladius sp.]|nr:CopG family transcriptional regulator [Thermogladius sp.]